MAVGLVNVSFSLPEWLAVKMIFFAPCSCVFKCLVILCIYFSILRFQHMKYLIHIFIISFLFSLYLSLKRLIESQRVKVTLFKRQFCILVLWIDLKNNFLLFCVPVSMESNSIFWQIKAMYNMCFPEYSSAHESCEKLGQDWGLDE